MKKILFSIIVLLLLSSCSKDDNNPHPDIPEETVSNNVFDSSKINLIATNTNVNIWEMISLKLIYNNKEDNSLFPLFFKDEFDRLEWSIKGIDKKTSIIKYI